MATNRACGSAKSAPRPRSKKPNSKSPDGHQSTAVVDHHRARGVGEDRQVFHGRAGTAPQRLLLVQAPAKSRLTLS
jgi:hypothetical protein